MIKFIPYEKLSKKQKRKIDQKRRGSWGNLNPVTRRSESKKIYNRAKSKRFGGSFFVLIQAFLLFRCNGSRSA